MAATVRQVFLRPGQLPPPDEDYVHLSISAVGHATVIARRGHEMQSTTYIESDSTSALAKSMVIAEEWARSQRAPCIYISRDPKLPPDG
jgi:hypothetical protein